MEGAPDATLPDLMNKSLRSEGFLSNPGFTSSTTWYWFNCVNMVDTSRWP